MGNNKTLSSKLAKEKISKWQKKFNDKFRFDKSKGSEGMLKLGNRGINSSPKFRREIEQQSKSQEMIGGHLGNLQQGPYPININININNSKKEGDIFQRNSANVSTKGFAKRIYNINKGFYFYNYLYRKMFIYLFF